LRILEYGIQVWHVFKQQHVHEKLITIYRDEIFFQGV
jgi:hypothetical protein